ncbi:hypothetical protein YWH7199_08440 [Fusobacterium nucleatum YWH7199]|uniref:hypothetical protein n=1 Tax=Fusobacterium nucleatum TaxID=851 RepID=UPI00201A8B9E|nr:hypothetical protein [Fusobacterium nucleatum]MCL4581422.1 hypothetical protein [Fusobacterium nucleatum YWH7199]
MKFIKFEFGNGCYELINLSNIQALRVGNNEIVIRSTNSESYYNSQEEARNYIKNFDEVKELLLKSSEN